MTSKSSSSVNGAATITTTLTGTGTNVYGTTTVETLAQARITSINLEANTTDINYSDGSGITGETTFTYSNGITETVAANDNLRWIRWAA